MGTEARVGAKNKGKFGFIEQYSGEAEMFVMPGSGGSGGRPGGERACLGGEEKGSVGWVVVAGGAGKCGAEWWGNFFH